MVIPSHLVNFLAAFLFLNKKEIGKASYIIGYNSKFGEYCYKLEICLHTVFQDIFSKADRNCSGFLDVSELKRAIQTAGTSTGVSSSLSCPCGSEGKNEKERKEKRASGRRQIGFPRGASWITALLRSLHCFRALRQKAPFQEKPFAL